MLKSSKVNGSAAAPIGIGEDVPATPGSPRAIVNPWEGTIDRLAIGDHGRATSAAAIGSVRRRRRRLLYPMHPSPAQNTPRFAMPEPESKILSQTPNQGPASGSPTTRRA